MQFHCAPLPLWPKTPGPNLDAPAPKWADLSPDTPAAMSLEQKLSDAGTPFQQEEDHHDPRFLP
jgi:hypothetical protein